jgi:hypothetical protein
MELTNDTPQMTYKYVFEDGHIEYAEHLNNKEELEQEHGKLLIKSEVRT